MPLTLLDCSHPSMIGSPMLPVEPLSPMMERTIPTHPGLRAGLEYWPGSGVLCWFPCFGLPSSFKSLTDNGSWQPSGHSYPRSSQSSASSTFPKPDSRILQPPSVSLRGRPPPPTICHVTCHMSCVTFTSDLLILSIFYTL